MNIGRNDPCPCGSGKKYKKCCLIKEDSASEGLFWRRLHSMRNGLITKILKFTNQTYGEIALDEAWDEFHLFQGIPFDPDSVELQIFLPWFYYNWTPDPEETEIKKTAPIDFPPAATFLEKKRRHLDDMERDYIKACLNSPFSFFQIIECNPGQGFTLKDIFTESVLDVVEKSGSEDARPGDMLFAKPVTINGLTTLEASAPLLIPPIQKLKIIALRKQIQKQHNPISSEDLFDYDLECLELYNHFYEMLHKPELPKLCNTDGDPLLPHTLIYEIDSPQAVFNALKELNFEETEKNLLKNAKFDQAGNLIEVKFSWLKKGNKKHKGWSNTVLGQIRINRTTLQVEVNSGKRATKFQAELTKRIKEGVRFKKTIVESMEKMLDKSRNKKAAPAILSKEQEDLMNHPEVQAQITKMMEEHWKNWVNEKVPALNNKTPIEAARTEEGREMLDALLTQFERYSTDHPQNGTTPEIFRKIRQQLNILD